MNKKSKGSRRERQTIELLQTQGYACTKSGGSLGVFDVDRDRRPRRAACAMQVRTAGLRRRKWNHRISKRRRPAGGSFTDGAIEHRRRMCERYNQ